MAMILDDVRLRAWAERFPDALCIDDLVLGAFRGMDVRSLYEDVLGERFYEGCDQYAVALGSILALRGIDVVMLRTFEIDHDAYLQGVFSKVAPPERYAHLGYVPHNVLLVTHNDKGYLISPKYLVVKDGSFVSKIPAGFHSEKEAWMRYAHQEDPERSVIYLPVLPGRDGFPVHIKEKGGKIKAYLAFEKYLFL